jgi:hypothetical protein
MARCSGAHLSSQSWLGWAKKRNPERAGGVAQVAEVLPSKQAQSPEFKPRTTQKKKKGKPYHRALSQTAPPGLAYEGRVKW